MGDISRMNPALKPPVSSLPRGHG